MKQVKLSLLLICIFMSSILTVGVAIKPAVTHAAVFTHSGIIYSAADLIRAKQNVAAGISPWIDAWNAGKTSSYASTTYTPGAVAAPARWGGHPELNAGNTQMFNDSEAALIQAIIWKVSSNSTEADAARLKSEAILDAWSSTVNTEVGGDEKQLLAGLNGYKFAAAADIMAGDATWVSSGKYTAVKNMLLNYFLPPLRDYLANHYGKNPTTYPYYYRGNQDIAAMVTIMAIGVLNDDLTIYNEAVNHFKSGAHNGRVTYYLFPTSDTNLAQSEESGRDQAHAQLGIGLLSTMAQISYNQHISNSAVEDLYEYSNRLILRGVEYSAKYNNGYTVPYSPLYTTKESTISASARGNLRPIYSMVWNHYHFDKGLADAVATDPVYYSKSMAAATEPEGISTDHQAFTTLLYTQEPIVSGEIYSLQNPGSGKMLDVASGATANGTNVQIWQDTAGDNQRFTISKNSDGTYRLIGLQSDKALEVNANGTTDGSNVQIYTYNGGANQRWNITNNSDGTFRLTGVGSSKSLDVNANGTSNGTNVQIWTSNSGASQKWKLIRGGVVSGGTYKIQNPNSSKLLSVTGSSTANGANVEISQDTGSTSQQWTITSNTDGTYTIIGVQSGKALEVYGAGNTDGTNVDIWPNNYSANQKWRIIMNADGTYKFVDSNSNRVLEVNGSGTSDSTNVQISLNSNAAGQKWKLIKQ